LSKGLALFTSTVADSELGVADAVVQVEADQCFYTDSGKPWTLPRGIGQKYAARSLGGC